MNVRPSILCPVDFSDASAGALRYAAAIAAPYGARILILTVENPLLSNGVDLGAGIVWSADDCKRELARFASKALGPEAAVVPLEFQVAIGKPATEILRACREHSCRLIVISSHGLTGMRKLFFGSTTERVLRDTTQPVLVTPPATPRVVRFEDAKRLVGRILVPVDLTGASLHQTTAARAVAQALGVPLILAHVIEPVRTRLAPHLHFAGIEADRRAIAEDRLNELMATVPPRSEALVAYGDPAEEVAKIAADRKAGLIVMGLHASPLLGPRMGSVTYRVLCLAPTLVLAVPPEPLASVAAVSVDRAASWAD